MQSHLLLFGWLGLLVSSILVVVFLLEERYSILKVVLCNKSGKVDVARACAVSKVDVEIT